MPRTDKLEIDKRVRMVMEWIIEDWPTCDIIAQVQQKWGIEQRQAKRYIADARKRWAQQETEQLDVKLQQKIQTLKKLKLSLKPEYKGTPKGIRAVLAVERELIALEKMRPALKVQLSDPNGDPIQVAPPQIVYVRDSNVDYGQLENSILEAIVKAKKKSET